MTVAFDLDGTLSRYPHELGEVMRALRASDHLVVVLTGSTGGSQQVPGVGAIETGSTADRERQLTGLGLEWGTDYDNLVICEGMTFEGVADAKGRWCRQNGVSLFIDDSAPYCEAVRRISPATAVLQVFHVPRRSPGGPCVYSQ